MVFVLLRPGMLFGWMSLRTGRRGMSCWTIPSTFGARRRGWPGILTLRRSRRGALGLGACCWRWAACKLAIGPRGGRGTIEPSSGCRAIEATGRWTIARRSASGETFPSGGRAEISWNPRSRMFENAAIVAPKVAAIKYRGTARNIGGVVVLDYATAPVRRPVVITPTVVGKQSNGNADRGKSKPHSQGESEGRWRYIKARVGRNPPAVDPPRVIVRDVNEARIYGNNCDEAAAVIHALLRRVSQVSGLLRLYTRGLDGVHHVARLVVVSIA